MIKISKANSEEITKINSEEKSIKQELSEFRKEFKKEIAEIKNLLHAKRVRPKSKMY